MRVRLTLEYDGTSFAGFQFQGQGERTIQGILEAAIQGVGGLSGRVYGAGRTDAGVHASGQVAHFDTDWTVPEDRIVPALNSALPRDLVVKAACVVNPEFHARFDATARIYRYTILNRKAPSALLGRFALHLRDELDLAQMRLAAAELTGLHDFAAFGIPDSPGKSTVRRIDAITIRTQKDCVLITVRGNAFLRQMVRALVGTLLPVGLGKITPETVRQIRDSADRNRCPSIAAAHGLCLVHVEYDGSRHRLESIKRNRTDENIIQDTDHEDLFGEAE
jgi:tRNA pseudouridine38-40 synthase